MRRVACTLALRVGNPDVDAVLDSISWRQLTEWRAYDNEIGLDRGDDIATAIGLLGVIVSRFTGGRMKLKDFVPRVYKPPRQTGRDMKRRCQQIARLHNAAARGEP